MTSRFIHVVNKWQDFLLSQGWIIFHCVCASKSYMYYDRVCVCVCACISQFSSVAQSCPTLEPQHTRPPCPTPTPRVHPNPCPLSQGNSPWEKISRNSFAPRLGNAVHRRQGKRASYREKEALLLLDDQAARVCETSLVPYWPQLRRCLLFRARTQAYLEKG